MPITILDLAKHRGVVVSEDGSITADALADVGLGIMGGCCGCGASIACYNAYPSKSGYWKCADCIGDDGWDDVEEAELDIKAQRYST